MQNDHNHGLAAFGRRQQPVSLRDNASLAAGTAANAVERPMAPVAHDEDPLGRIKIRVFGLILEAIEVATINKLRRAMRSPR